MSQERLWSLLASIVAHRGLFHAAADGAETAGYLLLRRQILSGAETASDFQALAQTVGPAAIAHLVESLTAHEVRRLLRKWTPGSGAIEVEAGRALLLALAAAASAPAAPPATTKRLTRHAAMGARRLEKTAPRD